MPKVEIVHFDDQGNLMNDSIEVTQEELGVECWAPVRFLGGECDRHYICKYAVKANCKAGPSKVAREKLEHEQLEQLEEGEEIREELVCRCCGEVIELEPGDAPYCGDEGTSYAGEPVCDSCYDDDLCEPCATLYYGPDPEDECFPNDDYPRMIGACRNETEGDFTVQYHKTDAWRGYYELKSEHYVQLFTDAILSHHESEEMLKELYDRLLERLRAAGIGVVRGFCRSSNVFFTSLEIWVEKDWVKIPGAHMILAEIKAEVDYDNPLYTTGILFPREILEKAKSLLGAKYGIERDSDLADLAARKGADLLQEIQEAAMQQKEGGD